MKNKFKNQNGVISVFAMLAMLFFLLFILGAYMTVSRSNRTQKESNDEILKIYSTEVNAQDIYDEMISYDSDVIPLYTYEQVDNIGSGNFYAITGKIYYFKPTTNSSGGLVHDSDKNYELKNNLNVPDLNYVHSKYNKIDRGEYKYVENNSLKLSLDGTNNTGEGYSDQTAKWTNLISKTRDLNRYDIYGGGKSPLKEGEVNWVTNGLSFDGVGDFVLCNNVINSGNSSETLEIVFKTNSSNSQRLLGSWGDASGGGLSITSSSLRGDLVLNGNVNRSVIAPNIIQSNKITYAALTFDGKKICLYKNGKKVSEDSENVVENASTETINYKTPKTMQASVNGSDKTIKMGITTYIGKEGETSANGITLSPYFYYGANYIIPSYKTQGGKTQFSKVYIKNSVTGEQNQTGISYYQNIADLKRENMFKFVYSLQAAVQTGLNDVNITFDYTNGLKIGNTDDEAGISIFSTGTDSVVIKSNIGKIQTWYFNGTPKSPKATNGAVKILGKYYYAFDNLEPDTEYEIKGEFKVDDIRGANIKAVTGKYADSIFVGNSYNNKFDGATGGGFNGIIYAVRVYNKALTEDQIKSNYKIDKSRFSIID